MSQNQFLSRFPAVFGHYCRSPHGWRKGSDLPDVLPHFWRAFTRVSRVLATLALTACALTACSLQSTPLFDPDGDGVLSGVDCNDLDPEVGALFEDLDGDGHGGQTLLISPDGSACSSAQGSSLSDDCNDSDGSVSPGVAERCNGQDDNCNGSIDDDAIDQVSVYLDADRDGFGSASSVTLACSDTLPTGYVSNADDCNDGDKDINPDEVEICDERDQNCNDETDETPKDGVLYYVDSDQDGYGVPGKGVRFCPGLAPEGYADNTDDCNDASDKSYPGALETCDGLDNDCNTLIDDAPVNGILLYQDSDLDGYGDPENTVQACGVEAGLSNNGQDCNDTDAAIYPNASERCNLLDDNCNGLTDEGLPDLDQSGLPDCREVAYIISAGFSENGDIQGCGELTNIGAQQAQVASVLDALGLSLVPFVDDHVVGLSSEAISRYPLVIYDDGGWTDTLLVESVEALQAAERAGASLLFMGDDLVSQAFAYNQSRDSRALYDLLWISQWKAGGTTQRGAVILDVDHPVLDGPAGSISDFAYYGDMDVSISAGQGEVVLANIFGSLNPAIVAMERKDGRTVVMLPSTYATVVNCPVSDTNGLVQLRALLWNSVSWLMYRDDAT